MALAEELNLDFDTPHPPPGPGDEGDEGDEVDEAFGLLVDVLRTMPTDDAVGRVGRYQNRLTGLEAELLARRKAEGASDRDIETEAGRSRTTSKAEAKKKVRRAKAVDENPDLAGHVGNGDLGTEQLDAIAEASDKTGGDAARDEDFIGRVKEAPPDRAKEIARDYIDNHQAGPDGNAETRHRSQRRRRRASRYVSHDDLDTITIKGDRAAVEEMWRAISGLSKKLYRLDGGRDVPTDKHPRTRNQRLFDAAHRLLSGAESKGGSSKRATKASTATLFMWIRLEDAETGDFRATYADGSHVPESVLGRHMCTGSVAGVVFGADGEILWHGREIRFATPEQVRALIARDRGCVMCRAGAEECEAHHLVPFNAPAKGETNVEEMVLVCTDCHHWLHDTDHTLVQDESGHWRPRPAAPEEIAPRNHRHHHR